VAQHVGFDLSAPWQDLPPEARAALLHGTGADHVTFEWRGRYGTWKHGGTFEGVLADLHARHKKTKSPMLRRFYEQFMRQSPCPRCQGARLRPEALAITLTSQDAQARGHSCELNINQVCQLALGDALHFFEHLVLDGPRKLIAEEPLKEIRGRLRFLLDVGLEYLTLDRSAPSLAGGESQRIRLASQIGCGLVGVLYVLDEPSVGLHPRDNRRLLSSLQRLRDLGNTVIIVEHDRDTMDTADQIVDFGPGPGVRGGRVVAQGSIQDLAAAPESLTGAFLAGRERIPVPEARRPVNRPISPLRS
jgi:excinuclease ABC subunit A